MDPDMTEKQFSIDLQALIARRGLCETRAAGLLGVPVYTLRKWIAGQRAPSAAAVRLLGVLGALEALAPALLEALEPAPLAVAHVGKVQSESDAHVEKIQAKPRRSRKKSPE